MVVDVNGLVMNVKFLRENDGTWLITSPSNKIPDTDADGISDTSDNCPSIANANQLNTDGDAQGDACDTDDDNDSIAGYLGDYQWIKPAAQRCIGDMI